MEPEAKKTTENLERIKVNDKVVEDPGFGFEQEKSPGKPELPETFVRPEKIKIPEKEIVPEDDIPQPPLVSARSISPAARQREKSIEKELEKDMGELYSQMPPEKQLEFKRKGEETARKINLLLEKTKVKARQIIELIKSWLLIIPGINKFFVEQEAKIKTDEIMKLKGN